MPAWLCSIKANSEWYIVNKLFRKVSSVYESHILHQAALWNYLAPCKWTSANSDFSTDSILRESMARSLNE